MLVTNLQTILPERSLEVIDATRITIRNSTIFIRRYRNNAKTKQIMEIVFKLLFKYKITIHKMLNIYYSM